MTSSYLDNLLEQPAALQATVDDLNHRPPLGTVTHKLYSGKYRRVILTGMGSSYYGLYPLLLRLYALPLGVIWLQTAELIHHAACLVHPENLIIAVSQSGQSAELVKLLDLTYQRLDLIGVTNTPGSLLAERARFAIITRAGEEASVSCKTYISALAAHAWLGDQLLDDPSHFPVLAEIPQKLADYWFGWQDSVAALQRWLKGVGNLYLLGRGSSMAAAFTGALIIKEAAGFGAEGMNSAAFRHGPLEVVSPHTRALVYGGCGESASLNARIAADIITAGGQAQLVGMAEGSPPFHLPPCNEYALPLLEITFAQMVSLALAQINGHTAGKFVHAQKITNIE
jgi:glucosamine--fructose-6-phosphate aminotransferase (isomerizing)